MKAKNKGEGGGCIREQSNKKRKAKGEFHVMHSKTTCFGWIDRRFVVELIGEDSSSSVVQFVTRMYVPRPVQQAPHDQAHGLLQESETRLRF